MNVPSPEPARRCRVVKAYQAEFPDPIAVEAGETLAVHAEKISTWEQNPAWIWLWCTDLRGKSGWTPKNVIQMDASGQSGTARVAYDARELTIAVGQELTIEREESGWLWCQDQQGRRGWVPISHVTM